MPVCQLISVRAEATGVCEKRARGRAGVGSVEIGFGLGLNWVCFWAESRFLAQNERKLGLLSQIRSSFGQLVFGTFLDLSLAAGGEGKRFGKAESVWVTISLPIFTFHRTTWYCNRVVNRVKRKVRFFGKKRCCDSSVGDSVFTEAASDRQIFTDLAGNIAYSKADGLGCNMGYNSSAILIFVEKPTFFTKCACLM